MTTDGVERPADAAHAQPVTVRQHRWADVPRFLLEVEYFDAIQPVEEEQRAMQAAGEDALSN